MQDRRSNPFRQLDMYLVPVDELETPEAAIQALVWTMDDLKRAAYESGKAQLSAEDIDKLCRNLASLVDSADRKLHIEETFGIAEEDAIALVAESEAIIAGRYDRDQDKLVALAAVIRNLLMAPADASARKLAQAVLDNFLESYGEPSPLAQVDLSTQETERLATDAGFLKDSD